MVQRLLVLSASLQNLTIIKKKQLGEFLPIFLNIFWFINIHIYISHLSHVDPANENRNFASLLVPVGNFVSSLFRKPGILGAAADT